MLKDQASPFKETVADMKATLQLWREMLFMSVPTISKDE